MDSFLITEEQRENKEKQAAYLYAHCGRNDCIRTEEPQWLHPEESYKRDGKETQKSYAKGGERTIPPSSTQLHHLQNNYRHTLTILAVSLNLDPCVKQLCSHEYAKFDGFIFA